jgi:hypothetical protein
MTTPKKNVAVPRLIYEAGGLSISVELPEHAANPDGAPQEIGEADIERAMEAVVGALNQYCEVFIDGEDKPPAKVWIEPWSMEEADNWHIE